MIWIALAALIVGVLAAAAFTARAVAATLRRHRGDVYKTAPPSRRW